MNLDLIEICDEIFQSQRLPILGRTVSLNQMVFHDFPWKGLKTTAEDRLTYWTIYVQDQLGGRVYTRDLNLPTFPETVEQVLRFIYVEFADYLDQPNANATKAHHEPETTLATPTATLTINATTPTSILRDLAARALGWVDRPYDPVENGSKWHCEAQNAPYGPSIYKTQWKPDQNAEQTLALIANLGINVTVNHDEEEIKSRVLIEAAKIGARKLGESS